MLDPQADPEDRLRGAEVVMTLVDSLITIRDALIEND